MATADSGKTCKNVGELRKFIATIPDNIPICGAFDDSVQFTLWKRDSGESGPKLWMGIDEE